MSDTFASPAAKTRKRPRSPAQTEPSSSLSDAPTILFSPSSSERNTPCPSPASQSPSCSKRRATVERIRGLDTNSNVEQDAQPRARLTAEEKLNLIVDTLRATNWTFEDFIRAWVGTQDHHLNVRLRHRRYGKVQARRAVMKAVMDELDSRKICHKMPLEAVCARELDQLVRSQAVPFGKFDFGMTMESLNCDEAISIVQDRAPQWYNLIMEVFRNRRTRWNSYAETKDDAVQRLVFAVTSMACFSRSRKTSTTFATCMDLYLQGSGVHRRVVETLHGFGFCHSYKTGNDIMTKLAKHSSDQLKKQAFNPKAVAVYDNINFSDRKRHEETGHRAKFHSFTNAAWVVCDDLPSNGLTQSMHNPTVPLCLDDIALSDGILGDADTSPSISRRLIAEAIQRLHQEAVDDHVFAEQPSTFPTFPVVKQLSPAKTQFWQFAGITADEATIEGTYKVHDEMFLGQLGFKTATEPGGVDTFTDRLFLVHGDQLTTSRIRTVQHERLHATLPYDRRAWLLAVPSWFHIQYNLLLTIVRTHWQPVSGETDTHCVFSDAMRWNRSQTSRDNVKYHLMEPILTQGFTSRVAALFYVAMQKKGLLSIDLDIHGRKDVLDKAIGALSQSEFVELVEDVRLAAFTPEAWRNNVADVDFRTMCRYLQQVELFLTIRRAVKYGDIGLLRRVVDPLIITFFGAGQNNYGREMLYYRWLLSPANAPELQHAILASGLNNWRGHAGAFKPIDLALEHLNCACKVDLRNLKNSTHDIEIVFKRTTVCNAWIRALREQLETEYGEAMPSTHTAKAAIDDMFLLAWKLYIGGFGALRDKPLSSKKMFDSIDIRRKGMALLEANVKKFNAEHVRCTAIGTVLPPDDTNELEFVDISEFADVVHPGFDAVDNPTFNIALWMAEGQQQNVAEVDLTV